jgi:hypothetical protein
LGLLRPAIHAGPLLFATHEEVGYPFDLTCLEPSSGKVLWKSRVWACWWGSSTGQHRSWVKVVEQGERVVVFGVASMGFYVEGFHTKDGGNLFRVSNSY